MYANLTVTLWPGNDNQQTIAACKVEVRAHETIIVHDKNDGGSHPIPGRVQSLSAFIPLNVEVNF